ncbi:hypothetical protein [Bacillus toyonensis]|uniref:hypothetical protein n=1 Tax=Bacillus toyonensis TaxID=155322 RepID=UPI002E1F1B81|nr:hypothetical protein [Bacillus toyonensis]
MFHSNQEPLEILPAELEVPKSIEQTKNKPECCGEVEIKIPCCCTIQVPHGFQFASQSTPKIAYHVDCLSAVKELCRKTIHVDYCGPI